MRRHLLERLGHLVFVLWAVASLTFLMFRLMPVDPTLNFLTPSFDDTTRASLLRSFGLDRPLWEQYGLYLWNLLRGDLGMSFLQARPVLDLLLEALPNTLILTVVSLCVAYAFGIVAGAFLAFARGSVTEAAAIPLALATRAAPEFWLGMLLLTALAFQAGWFPTGGALSPGTPSGSAAARMVSGDFWWHLALPALTLTLYLQGLPLLLMRATMLEVLGDEIHRHGPHEGPVALVHRHASRRPQRAAARRDRLRARPRRQCRRQRGGGNGVRLARYRPPAGERGAERGFPAGPRAPSS